MMPAPPRAVVRLRSNIRCSRRHNAGAAEYQPHMHMKKHILALLMISAGCHALAYNENHGPFPEKANINKIGLTKLPHQFSDDSTNEVTKCTVLIPGQEATRLNLVWKEKEFLWFAELVVDGKTVLQPTACSDIAAYSGLDCYTADLNQDRTDDFIIYTEVLGLGLTFAMCNVAIILSSKEGYTLTTISTLFPEEISFILLNKKPYFIHTSFHRVNECKDGKNHNFWVYNLLAIGKNGLKVDNSAHPAFPKTIWYTFKPNHSETTIITPEQKAELRKQSLTDIFWKKKEQ
jgi:hypothetical protein